MLHILIQSSPKISIWEHIRGIEPRLVVIELYVIERRIFYMFTYFYALIRIATIYEKYFIREQLIQLILLLAYFSESFSDCLDMLWYPLLILGLQAARLLHILSLSDSTWIIIHIDQNVAYPVWSSNNLPKNLDAKSWWTFVVNSRHFSENAKHM